MYIILSKVKLGSFVMNAQLRLNEKVAIITGAGSSGPGVGIGKAISILFANQGC